MNKRYEKEVVVTKVDLSDLYCETGVAQLSDMPLFENAVRQIVNDGDVVVLCGPAPVWLYLRIAHALHGRVRTLYYESPVIGRLVIFDHDALRVESRRKLRVLSAETTLLNNIVENKETPSRLAAGRQD